MLSNDPDRGGKPTPLNVSNYVYLARATKREVIPDKRVGLPHTGQTDY